MISYAAGARMLQLMGGVSLSFYDWYCDLPPASPETWGEQTDVHESADWYNAKLLAVMGSNLNMTRTPDCHFAAEARHNGTKMWVFSPDFNQVAKYADEWVADQRRARTAPGGWRSTTSCSRSSTTSSRCPYFLDYAQAATPTRRYLVELERSTDGEYRAGAAAARQPPGAATRTSRTATGSS